MLTAKVPGRELLARRGGGKVGVPPREQAASTHHLAADFESLEPGFDAACGRFRVDSKNFEPFRSENITSETGKKGFEASKSLSGPTYPTSDACTSYSSTVVKKNPHVLTGFGRDIF